jgi:hypothetical protein
MIITNNLNLILIVFVIVAVSYYLISNGYISIEKFDKVEIEQPEITITPTFIEPELGLVTSSYEFVGLPKEILPAWGGRTSLKTDGVMKDMNCSKSCCSPQYPPPFKLAEDPNVGDPSKYVKSNINCYNYWQDSGCLCMSKEQSFALEHRGGNS